MIDKPLLALLEIGKSPAPEMEAEFRRVLGDRYDIRCFGALDHLTNSEIACHPPESDEDTLFTTLPPDGLPVLISKRLVIKGLYSQIRMLNRQDVNTSVSILCCTGEFPGLESPNVLTASSIISKVLSKSVAMGSKLGVFIPEEKQDIEAREQRKAKGYEVVVVPLNPEASIKEIEKAAYCMRALAPDTILYDCMGYTDRLQLKAGAIHSTTAILAVDAVAQFAKRHFDKLHATTHKK